MERTQAAPFFVDGRVLPVLPMLVAYALIHFVAAGAGYQLRLSQELATVFWPPAGLLLTALWLISAARWPALLAAAFAAELAAGFVFGESELASVGAWVETAYYACANLCCGVIAAGTIRRRVSLERTPAVPAILAMILIGAFAALVGAALGAFGLSVLFAHGDFLDNLQLWWANTWLGFVIVAPVTAAWYRHLSGLSYIVVRARRVEFTLVYLVAIVLAMAVFVAPPTPWLPLLQLPHLLFIPVIWSGLRLAPRHSMLIALIVTLIAVVGTRAGLGTFALAQDDVARTLSLQIFLASIALVPLFIGLVNEERERAFAALAHSEERYRHFLADSREAVWRMELLTPLPTRLSAADQAQRLRGNLQIAECNSRYTMWRDGPRVLASGVALDEFLGAVELGAHWPRFVADGYSIDGVEIGLSMRDGTRRTLLVSYRGILENDALVRIWGTARDVTELKRVQTDLRRERERLRGLALELVEAEERARQRLARTLHDGLGQDLYGMSLLLGALRGRVGEDPRVQDELQEAERLARGAAESTRGVINDLSPPGLYELGLGPALEWLVSHMKSRHALEVELQLEGQIDDIALPARVLVFRAISELLVNVAKHAQTDRAAVSVRRRAHCLEAEVVDRGRGFEVEASRPSQRAENGGFGLPSLFDQIRTAAGDFQIDSAPGAGTRSRLRVPCGGAEPASSRNELS